MTITIYFDSLVDLYGVKVNGNVLLECLAKDEVDDLTIGEIRKIAHDALENA